MAYDPNLYNPMQLRQTSPYSYGYQPQVPVNGLVRIESIEGAQMYYLPPNSVSPPLFLGSENAFYIKTTDGGGAATIKKYVFEEVKETIQSDSEFVTREYFDSWANRIMEAIDGKHSIQGSPEQELHNAAPQQH